MDEILLANFMTFIEVFENEDYDLWIGDEAWEVDHYLFENPSLKRAPFAWLTDFVGWLPVPSGGERDVLLTADYNAEMIEHVARYPRLRDRAIFIGRPEDIVDVRFGLGLARIRDWTEENFEFSGGYVLELDPGAVDRGVLRAQLGYGPDEVVAIAAIGGSGIGRDLLVRLIEAYPLARAQIPGLRLIAVGGPRLDPASLPVVSGVDIRSFVPDLNLHLAACDIGLVQGGLTTTMELAAYGRPFLYFPLRDHCEQQFHVHERLRRYGAGRRVDFDGATPESIAGATWYEYPHLAVNSLGDMLVAYSVFGSSRHPSAGYSYRDHTDALGSTRDPLIYKAGEDYYDKQFTTARNRWGDYSKCQVDPSDDKTLWALQEYAKARVSTDDGTTGSNGSRWSSYWASVSSGFQITASAGANGSISPSGTVSVAQGGSQTFTITPNACYSVSNVLVDGVSVGAVTSYTFTNVQANHTISATFAINTFTITASAGANGSISPSGAVSVNCGANQAFTITPNAC